jgi:hypothetical protein
VNFLCSIYKITSASVIEAEGREDKRGEKKPVGIDSLPPLADLYHKA